MREHHLLSEAVAGVLFLSKRDQQQAKVLTQPAGMTHLLYKPVLMPSMIAIAVARSVSCSCVYSGLRFLEESLLPTPPYSSICQVPCETITCRYFSYLCQLMSTHCLSLLLGCHPDRTGRSCMCTLVTLDRPGDGFALPFSPAAFRGFWRFAKLLGAVFAAQASLLRTPTICDGNQQ